jgi:hypothetical protein
MNQIWPRQVMLHALVLVADQLQRDIHSSFPLQAFCDQLTQCTPFKQQASLWLQTALKEQIILVEPQGCDLRPSSGWLHRQHIVVQKALFTRESILKTLRPMLAERDWISWNALDQALSTARVLMETSEYRRAWLELLVNTGNLLVRPVPHPGGTFMVATLSLRREYHPIDIILEAET